MLLTSNIQLLNQITARLPSLLFMTLLKGSLLFAVMYLLIARMKWLSSRLRHSMWLYVLCGIFFIALFQGIAPSYDIEVFKETAQNRNFGGITAVLVRSQEALTHTPKKTPAGTYASSSSSESAPLPAVSSNTSKPGNGEIIQSDATSYRKTLPGNLSLSFGILLIWAGGILVCLTKTAIGRIGLKCLIKRANAIEWVNRAGIIRQLSDSMGIKREVKVLDSVRCGVPFTCGILKPVVLLPADVENWPMERLQIVLVHEMAHVKRKDCLIRLLAKMICAIFWFMPFVWIAHRNLLIEQENACDAWVLSAGTKPAAYAQQIVDLVRISRGHLLLAGVYSALGRKNILEKRIVNVLSFKKQKPPKRFNHGWRVFLVGFLCLLPLSIMNPVVAGNEVLSIRDRELLYGTWINTSYKRGSFESPKMVVSPDGKVAEYILAWDTEPFLTGPLKIEERWTDREGFTYYKVDLSYREHPWSYYTLFKISSTGSTLEMVVDWHEYPSRVQPDDTFYIIYYRQEELHGIWVNTDSTGNASPRQRTDFYPDGTFADFRKPTDSHPAAQGRYTIERRWTDSGGNVWYKFIHSYKYKDVRNYSLCRIDSSSMTLELHSYTGGYPADIDPGSYLGTYFIFYRQ
jgi:beta-lactamase regulating signal transducer with metallopeptidase domain